MPKRFIHIVASIEQVLDLKIVGFEDVVGYLKAYEKHINEVEPESDQIKLMFHKTETSNCGSYSKRGGRGGRGAGNGGRRGGGCENNSHQ